MQTASACLDMVFQLLAATVCPVFILHGLCPDTSCHTPDHAVFRIHSIAEEERKIRCKVIDLHSTAHVIFNISKSICKCEGKLGYRVGACFSNMIPADADTVKILYIFINEILLHV